jgi:hypothetical protein
VRRSTWRRARPGREQDGVLQDDASRFGGRLAELIYTPGGMGIKDGRPFRYTGQVAADHYDHVHVAFDSGRPGIGDGIGQIQEPVDPCWRPRAQATSLRPSRWLRARR